jgi:predicted nucleic-acid-binding protein
VIALDTNILVRYLLNDDPKQTRVAAALLAQNSVYTAPPTVMLELVWVLKVNGCSREEIIKGLRLLLGLPNFKPKAFEALCYAVRWFEEGMDFGDALHLALRGCENIQILLRTLPIPAWLRCERGKIRLRRPATRPNFAPFAPCHAGLATFSLRT